MNDTNVLTAVTITTSQFYEDSGVLALARDYLQCYTGEYYFFQYDSDDYYIIMPTGDYSYSNTGVFVCDGAKVVKITRTVTSVPRSVTIPFSGTESGSVVGTENGGAYHGSVSGNSTQTVYDISTTYNSGVYYTDSSITVYNPNYFAVYGSFDDLPHLIEGVENYAYAGIILFFAVVAFALCDRLFKRLY